MGTKRPFEEIAEEEPFPKRQRRGEAQSLEELVGQLTPPWDAAPKSAQRIQFFTPPLQVNKSLSSRVVGADSSFTPLPTRHWEDLTPIEIYEDPQTPDLIKKGSAAEEDGKGPSLLPQTSTSTLGEKRRFDSSEESCSKRSCLRVRSNNVHTSDINGVNLEESPTNEFQDEENPNYRHLNGSMKKFGQKEFGERIPLALKPLDNELIYQEAVDINPFLVEI